MLRKDARGFGSARTYPGGVEYDKEKESLPVCTVNVTDMD